MNWQKPAIDGVLDPIHKAPELDRAYFYRFMRFISNEHMMSKLGNKTKECSGFASTWHDTPEAKRLAGNIYDGLTLLSPSADGNGDITQVEMVFAGDIDNDMSNFRTGDIVILYPYDKGSGARCHPLNGDEMHNKRHHQRQSHYFISAQRTVGRPHIRT